MFWFFLPSSFFPCLGQAVAELLKIAVRELSRALAIKPGSESATTENDLWENIVQEIQDFDRTFVHYKFNHHNNGLFNDLAI